MSKGKKKGKRGNNRPIRLPCEVNVSVPLAVDEAVARACSFLGQGKSQYMRDATMFRLTNERWLAPPAPETRPANTEQAA